MADDCALQCADMFEKRSKLFLIPTRGTMGEGKIERAGPSEKKRLVIESKCKIRMIIIRQEMKKSPTETRKSDILCCFTDMKAFFLFNGRIVGVNTDKDIHLN